MSILEKLDARVKFIVVLTLTLLVFLVDKLPAAVCLVLSFIVIRLIVKVPLRGLKYAKSLIFLVLFIVFTQTLFYPGSDYILKPLIPDSFPVLAGAGSLKWEGLFLSIVIICRLAALMLILPLLTETTPPHKLSAGLCALGVNYRSAFIITTAFNLIPFFKDEAHSIMDAQRLRGMRSFGIKAYTALVVPLMLIAMKKAQDSSVAMDCRAFGVYKTRTWLDKPKMSALDYRFIAVSVIFFTGLLFFNYW
ncbi:MAG: energy-coupling factor transporter transmembrane protein EcfT [Treponema sp.]|jgi:energy-coupling factor transporter transmembrane protein EcfT|nr:energy-coupling factor transporter transmembrane protein EcfT [Treponema sp.]